MDPEEFNNYEQQNNNQEILKGRLSSVINNNSQAVASGILILSSVVLGGVTGGTSNAVNFVINTVSGIGAGFATNALQNTTSDTTPYPIKDWDSLIIVSFEDTIEQLKNVVDELYKNTYPSSENGFYHNLIKQKLDFYRSKISDEFYQDPHRPLQESSTEQELMLPSTVNSTNLLSTAQELLKNDITNFLDYETASTEYKAVSTKVSEEVAVIWKKRIISNIGGNRIDPHLKESIELHLAFDTNDSSRQILREIYAANSKLDSLLDIERSAEKQAMIIELKEMLQELPVAVERTNLPHPERSLIGRDQDLDKLHELLTSSKTICSIEGNKGVGKTELALHFANVQAENTHSGFNSFVWIHANQDEDEQLPIKSWDDMFMVINQVLYGGNDPVKLTPRGQRAKIRDLMVANRSLLIIDGLSTLERVDRKLPTRVINMLPANKHYRVLATSRRDINRFDTQRAIATLPLNALSDIESIALFGSEIINEFGDIENISTECLQEMFGITRGYPSKIIEFVTNCSLDMETVLKADKRVQLFFLVQAICNVNILNEDIIEQLSDLELHYLSDNNTLPETTRYFLTKKIQNKNMPLYERIEQTYSNYNNT